MHWAKRSSESTDDSLLRPEGFNIDGNARRKHAARWEEIA
jgi:hypothetical protein